MKASELRALTNEELVKRLDEAQEELMNLRFNMSIGQLRDFNRLSAVKRDVARVQTLLNERHLAQQMATEN